MKRPFQDRDDAEAETQEAIRRKHTEEEVRVAKENWLVIRDLERQYPSCKGLLNTRDGGNNIMFTVSGLTREQAERLLRAAEACGLGNP